MVLRQALPPWLPLCSCLLGRYSLSPSRNPSLSSTASCALLACLTPSSRACLAQPLGQCRRRCLRLHQKVVPVSQLRLVACLAYLGNEEVSAPWLCCLRCNWVWTCATRIDTSVQAYVWRCTVFLLSVCASLPAKLLDTVSVDTVSVLPARGTE